jgi:hypothetical protein
VKEYLHRVIDIQTAKVKGEKAVEERKALLSETERRMNEIKDNLIQIRQQVSS